MATKEIVGDLASRNIDFCLMLLCALQTEYSLLTRMNGYYRQLGDVFLEILNKFSWKIVGMLFSDHLIHKNMGRSDRKSTFRPSGASYHVTKRFAVAVM